MKFSVRTLITEVQKALVETLDLALRRRFTVRDLTALRTFLTGGTQGSKAIVHRELCYVQSEGTNFRFDLYSSLADGVDVITPADRGIKPGRWRRCTLQAPYGRFTLPLCQVPPAFLEREDGLFGVARYAKQVQIYEGESTEEEMLTRLFGQRPSILVKWEDDQVTPRSNRPGCLYVTQQRFSVLCVAQNNRPDWQALQGSTLPDPSEGPGLNRMIGDVRYVLAGAQLGLGPYVERVEIGGARILEEDLSQRLFVGQVDIAVHASVHLADEELQPIEVLGVQPLLASGAPATDNLVIEGFTLAPGPGLERALARGAALVNNGRVDYEPTVLRFPASRDVYLDLQEDGTLFLPSAVSGAAPPALAGALRVGVVRTGAAEVLSFNYLCPTLVPWRGPYTIS